MNSKPAKYFVAKRQGKTKAEAKAIAGYSAGTEVKDIESTQVVQYLEKKYYKDELLREIALSDIAKAHAEIIKQDKDLGARNTAIKLALERVEPETNPTEENETVLFVLKK